jgi:SpoVK/Ycf46/Vps4 family AAA+-type ATPase
MRQSAGKNVINQFLAELDGVSANNEGVLIIGATNVPWHLDPAFRRPGRFDRIIFVPPPDQQNRTTILKLKLQNKPQGVIDFEKLGRLTPNYSGADLEAIVDIAVEQVLESAIETGIPKPLETAGLLKAIEQHRASTVDWFSTAKNYATFANQSGQYDAVSAYLKNHKDL